ncbi:MAG: hypothetical protein CVT98_04370 [Bacteroidetes bacterium HGW-Bacteroidetes-15]|nr:MAG: hypothetical protein CVT98_04370 [Bacteroidetes bacterium HGW-Bacteroidetes-15]
MFIGLTTNTTAQSYRNRQLALISYDVNISQSLKVLLDEQAHLFPDVENRKADKIIAQLKERSWYLIKDRLETETEMYILPLNAHGKSFSYDVYGFPEVQINKALRVGTSKYYIKVDLSLSSVSYQKESGYGSRPSQVDSSEIIVAEEGSVIPQVTITVTTYTDKGIIPMQKVSGSITVPQPWVISEEIFTGLINRNEFSLEEPTTIMGLINMATTELLKNIK